MMAAPYLHRDAADRNDKTGDETVKTETETMTITTTAAGHDGYNNGESDDNDDGNIGDGSGGRGDDVGAALANKNDKTTGE